MFTTVYSCSPTFTTGFFYLCLHLITYVYTCLPMFISVYSFLPMFTYTIQYTEPLYYLTREKLVSRSRTADEIHVRQSVTIYLKDTSILDQTFADESIEDNEENEIEEMEGTLCETAKYLEGDEEDKNTTSELNKLICKALRMLCMFTYVYPCVHVLSMFATVYLCLPMSTTVYSCLFIHVYLCWPIFTLVYLCLSLFTRAYQFLSMFELF